MLSLGGIIITIIIIILTHDNNNNNKLPVLKSRHTLNQHLSILHIKETAVRENSIHTMCEWIKRPQSGTNNNPVNLTHLRSSIRQLFAVPRHPLNTYGRRAFSVAGPTMCHLRSLVKEH